jgi:hypothetical protein
MPVFHMRRSVLQTLLRSDGQDLEVIEKDIDRDLKPHSLALKDWSADLGVKVTRSNKELPLKNVIGYLEGRGKLANEIVVVGAHYDHVGYGGFASMAQVKKPTIHHGADDNGSGTTSVMELARRFSQKTNGDRRRLVFMAFSGEELGLLGSAHYCKEPLFPLADTAAMVNLDMVGRVQVDDKTKKDKLFAEGLGSCKEFSSLLDKFNEKYDFQIKKDPKVIPYSDHASFYFKKVPVIFFWNSYHPDYHAPTDTSDKINVPGMRKIVDLTEDLLDYLSTAEQRPAYVQVRASASPGAGDVPRIGIRPTYGEEGDKGVLVDGISDDGPAAKAGIKAGDRIVEIGGKPVKNLEAYMSAMRAHKKGEVVELVVVRGDKRIPVKVKPE